MQFPIFFNDEAEDTFDSIGRQIVEMLGECALLNLDRVFKK